MEDKTLNNTLSNNDPTSENEIPNPKKGLMVAIIFGIVGAILWAVVVKVTGYNLGIAAIVVGAIVSQGFVWAGKGDSAIWGVIAAVIATLSILFGKIITIIILAAEFYGITIFEMMQVLDYGQLMLFMMDTFEPFDLVFYAIAIQTAYKRSFNPASKNYADYLKPNQGDEQTESMVFSSSSVDSGEHSIRPMATPESEAR